MKEILKKLNGTAKWLPAYVAIGVIIFNGIVAMGAQQRANKVYDEHLVEARQAMIEYAQFKESFVKDVAVIQTQNKEIMRRLEVIEDLLRHQR